MNCLDEGLLQALIDGELSAETRHEAEAHLALCPSCATAREEAARELALFSQALAVDEPLVVPTEQLRANIASAVAEMQHATTVERVASRESSDGRARSFWSSLAASLSPRQIAVFASLALAAVVLAATFFALRPGKPGGDDNKQPEVAEGTGAPTTVGGATAVTPEAAVTPAQINSQDASNGAATTGQIAKDIVPRTVRPGVDKIRPKGANETGKFRPKGADSGGLEMAGGKPGPKTPRPDLLPVERQFVREIASLENSIERRRLQTLSPTLRAEYERNVAVVDEAIASTRAAAKSNPQDRDAQEFLRAAYQEKLDLLSAVAGKSQLASADR